MVKTLAEKAGVFSSPAPDLSLGQGKKEGFRKAKTDVGHIW